jgi:hypothetical protein
MSGHLSQIWIPEPEVDIAPPRDDLTSPRPERNFFSVDGRELRLESAVQMRVDHLDWANNVKSRAL